MPIYEFYCSDCHTIYNFLSRTVAPEARPRCPRCPRPRLERRPSAFAISTGRSESPDADGLPDLDEPGVERAMLDMAREAEGLDENDPRQMARLMRKLFDSTGMNAGPEMSEALRRLEAGEDPDKIEEDMGELLEGDEAGLFGRSGRLAALGRKIRPPSVDDTLYEM